MFDVGFSELLVIAVVALIVLGPERLPKAARLAGLWVRKARAQWYAVKAELENELAAEELKRELRAPLAEARQALDAAGREVAAAASTAAAVATTAAPPDTAGDLRDPHESSGSETRPPVTGDVATGATPASASDAPTTPGRAP